MDARELPARPSLAVYQRLASDLALAWTSGDAEALRRLGNHYQLGRVPSREQVRAMAGQRLRKLRKSDGAPADLAPGDAQLLVADAHGFASWEALARHIAQVNEEGTAVARFESAVDAVVAGDLATLASMLRADPGLVRARSTRKHGSTLLHYTSANGVEDFRQKTPANAVDVTKFLLAAGAEVDAENDPGHGTTLGLVATSVHPLVAGVQIALLETLLQAGAAVDGPQGGWNPLIAALHNGRGQAAAFLAERGARLDLEGAAGVGRLDVVRSYFEEDGRLKASTTKEQLTSGFAWACEYGRSSVVEYLLQQRAVDVDVRLPHNRQTGLHWAAYGGHADVVKVLLEQHAPVDAKDESFGGTPLGWALYGWVELAPGAGRGNYYDVVSRLVAAGARAEREWLDDPDRELPIVQRVRADPRMLAALGKQAPA